MGLRRFAGVLRVSAASVVSSVLSLAAAGGVLVAAGAGVAGSAGVAAAQEAGTAAKELDQLILRDGRVVEGRVVSESGGRIELIVVVAGIEAPTSYAKDEVIRVVRGTWRDASSGDGAATGSAPDREAAPGRSGRLRGGDASAEGAPVSDRPTVYLLEITGETAFDIHPKPLRDAISDARRHEPDYLIVRLDNEWTGGDSNLNEELPDDVQDNFDAYQIVEQLEPIFQTEIPQTWAKQPEIVFWVHNAMGGICLLPFVADRIYFHPDGRMGGIGTLDELFEGVGDEVARQKQRSLRLARAQGIAIAGGYDYRLVTAMARTSYVLSYRLVGGRVELLERYPTEPGEHLLCDDGQDEREDSIQQRVRGETNDTLVLRAREAALLGVSEGTAASLDDVLDGLGILRNHEMLEGRGTDIMQRWADQRTRAEREFPRIFRDFVELPGDGRGDAREIVGRRIRYLEDMLALHRRFEGGLNIVNIFQRGVPGQFLFEQNLRIMIEGQRAALIAFEGRRG